MRVNNKEKSNKSRSESRANACIRMTERRRFSILDYKINSFGRMAVCVCVVFLIAVLAWIFAAGIYPPLLAGAREGHNLIQNSLDEQSGTRREASPTDNRRLRTPAPTSELATHTDACEFGYSNDDFAGGDGTAENPFLISTAQQLDNMRQFEGAAYAWTHFRLSNDIDLTEFLSEGNSGHHGGLGWQPIGSRDAASDEFFGNFDGAGHTISGLWINRPSQNNIGLFGTIYGSVSNLNIALDERGITGNNFVGAVGGFIDNMASTTLTLKNISATGNILGIDYIGGLFGQTRGTSGRIQINYSQFVGAVTSTAPSTINSSIIGGITADAFNTSFYNSIVKAKISPYQTSFVRAGAIAGLFRGSNTIVNCFAYIQAGVNVQPFFGGRFGFVVGVVPTALVTNSFYYAPDSFISPNSLPHDICDNSRRLESEELANLKYITGWDFTHTWGFDIDGNLVLRAFGKAYDPTRAVIINITGTGAEGVAHDAPDTILQTETVLQFTLTGIAEDATIILPYGGSLSGMTVTIPITADEAALILDIVITAYVPPPPNLTWLWISLGIIGGIALIGGAVFLALKLRKPKTITETVEVEKEVIVEREVPIIKKPLPSDLSDREKEVAMLVLRGYSRSKIALKMDIAESTITTYMERIYIKSGVDNQKEFVARFTGDA